MMSRPHEYRVHEVDGSLTRTQWLNKGFVPVQDARGELMWTNGWKQGTAVYYRPDEVESILLRPEPVEAAMHGRMQEKKTTRVEELQKIIKILAQQAAPENGGDLKLILDVETTGVDARTAELLQVTIINDNGETLFNELLKPCATSWDRSQMIHGITPEMVKNCPHISEKIGEINEILKRADIVAGYNVSFDINFLKCNGALFPDDVEIVDVMKLAVEKGVGGKRMKLTKVAERLGYHWEEKNESAHNALGDCLATLYVWDKLKTYRRQEIEW